MTGDVHPYHCLVCGQRLEEWGMDMLGCERCGTGYVPTAVDGKVSIHADLSYEEVLTKQEALDIE